MENIETFFSAVDLARTVGKFPDKKNASEIEGLYKDLVTVIVQTIEGTMPFKVSNDSIMPNGNYGEVAELVYQLHQNTNHKDCAFIASNYDVGLDYALSAHLIGFDYWLYQKAGNTNDYPLLKLHGSINWDRCQECKQISPYDVGFMKRRTPSGAKRYFADLGTKITSGSHCNKPLLGPPIVVPPALEKITYQTQLSPIWIKAVQELQEADNVFVIGYSLPETDLFFRSLVALGLEGGQNIRRFWVFNPDSSGEVKQRFNGFVGASVRASYQFHKVTFSDAIRMIAGDLQRHSY